MGFELIVIVALLLHAPACSTGTALSVPSPLPENTHLHILFELSLWPGSQDFIAEEDLEVYSGDPPQPPGLTFHSKWIGMHA